MFELNILICWLTLLDAVTEDFVCCFASLCWFKFSLKSGSPINYDLKAAALRISKHTFDSVILDIIPTLYIMILMYQKVFFTWTLFPSSSCTITVGMMVTHLPPLTVNITTSSLYCLSSFTIHFISRPIHFTVIHVFYTLRDQSKQVLVRLSFFRVILNLNTQKIV